MTATVHHLNVAFQPPKERPSFHAKSTMRMEIMRAAHAYANATTASECVVELLVAIDAMRSRGNREVLTDDDYEALLRAACSPAFARRGPDWLGAALRRIADEMGAGVAP